MNTFLIFHLAPITSGGPYDFYEAQRPNWLGFGLWTGTWAWAFENCLSTKEKL